MRLVLAADRGATGRVPEEYELPTERLIVAKRKTKPSASAPTGRRRRFWNYPRRGLGPVRRWLPSWRFIVGSFLLVIGVGVGLGAAAYYTTKVPETLPGVGQETSTVYWSDGTTVMTDFFVEDRTIIEYSTLLTCDGQPQFESATPGTGEGCPANAVVASEDSTFWTNPGVDLKGTARALVNNLTGGPRQGGSTITQQYVERYYTDTETSYAGKAKEAILALKIAESQSKQEIIGNYLNTIFFGRGAYGIEAASQAYFGIPAASLDYNQSAFIAGIIPSPNRYDNNPETGPAWAQERWQRSINRMAEFGYITPEQKAAAVYPTTIEITKDNRMAGPNGHLIQMVLDELAAQDFSEEDIYGGGLQIVTTFDVGMQAQAIATMDGVYLQDPAPAQELRGTLVSIDPASGAVKALYGGQDYLAVSQYNNAVQGSAQPGSTFKPFTLLGALEKGHDLNETYDGNSPRSFGKWKVANFGYQSFGTINLTKATAFSVNTVYAELNMEIGPETTAWTAYRAGIGRHGKPGLTEDTVSEVLQVNDANVLGTDNVHPVDLATAYATIAANGVYHPWHVLETVTNSDGETRFLATNAYQGEQVFEPELAHGTIHAMEQVVEMKGASGNPARDLDRPVAGKTGTSNDNVSAWFAGFTPQLVTTVGLFQIPVDDPSTPDVDESKGNASITPFGKWSRKEITGGTWPVEAWTEYMNAVMGDAEVLDFPKYTPKKPQPSESPSVEPTEELPVEEIPETVPVDGTVPAVAGMSRESAIGALQQAGFGIIETMEHSATVPAGTVIRSSPAGGTAPAGTSISIVVSSGPEVRPVPTPTPSTLPSPTPPVPEVPGAGGENAGAG